jgi:hypothetical protein
MITLNGQVVQRGSHVILFYDSQYHCLVNRVATSGDHLAVVQEVNLGDSSLVEIRHADVVVVSDSVGPIGYLSVDASGNLSVLVGNVQLVAPAPIPEPVTPVAQGSGTVAATNG